MDYQAVYFIYHFLKVENLQDPKYKFRADYVMFVSKSVSSEIDDQTACGMSCLLLGIFGIELLIV